MSHHGALRRPSHDDRTYDLEETAVTSAVPALAFARTGSGAPLVLLHGLGSSRAAWDSVVPALAERFDVVAVDLPGFGDSDPLPPGVIASPAALAASVAALLDGLGLDAPHLVGNSLGGWVALELAQLRPTASVTLLSPAGLWRAGAPRYGPGEPAAVPLAGCACGSTLAMGRREPGRAHPRPRADPRSALADGRRSRPVGSARHGQPPRFPVGAGSHCGAAHFGAVGRGTGERRLRHPGLVAPEAAVPAARPAARDGPGPRTSGWRACAHDGRPGGGRRRHHRGESVRRRGWLGAGLGFRRLGTARWFRSGWVSRRLGTARRFRAGLGLARGVAFRGFKNGHAESLKVAENSCYSTGFGWLSGLTDVRR